MITKEVKSVLEQFNIDVKYYATMNEHKMATRIVAVGGLEVLVFERHDKEIREMITKLGVGNYGIILDTTDMILPYVYTEIPFNINKLEELLVHKSKDSYSKAEASELGYTEKSELEDKIVYIFEETPVTNSLALAKQFSMKHRTVIKDLLKLGSERPSMLMQIEYKIYRDVIKQRNRKLNTETVGNGRPAPAGAGILNHETREIYNSYLEISEDVYYAFIQDMGRPKTPEMKILRNAKREEYFKAFQGIRKTLIDSGVKTKELEAMVKRRTEVTSELMSKTYDFSMHYNLNPINVNRFVFNIINHNNKINAVNYIPATDEEVKNGKTRHTRDEHVQQGLLILEHKILTALRMGKKFNGSMVDIMCSSINATEEELKLILKDYDVEFLYDEMSKHKK